MSGKILVVDDLAANRIVYKAMLTDAYYNVIMADSGNATAALAAQHCPDLILIGANLPDMTYAGLIGLLNSKPTLTGIPVMVILTDPSPDQRLDALTAGASDLICLPIEKPLLLARLRSLLRQQHSCNDLLMQAATADALGFADDLAAFRPSQRIAVLDSVAPRAAALRKSLAAASRHPVVALGFDGRSELSDPAQRPDAVVIRISPGTRDRGLQLMAELRVHLQTRQARIVVVLDGGDAALAATVLNMGADDAVEETPDRRELLLRLSIQLQRKSVEDRLRDKLQNGLQAALTDPLTGLYNRRFALSHLRRLVGGTGPGAAGFAVMLADLDYFKHVNDTHGHGAGDTVLSCVASRLRACLGAEDMLARIGGEEFLIVAPVTSPDGAHQTADRLRRKVREAPITLPGTGQSVRMTISIGISMGGPTGRFSAEALIERADRALYDSKAAGRDTVRVR